MTSPAPGMPVHLIDILNTMHVFGIVGDGETPPMNTATFELVGDDSVMTVPVLKGEKGDDGEPAPIVTMVWDENVVEPSDLPTNLGSADANKAWWLNNNDSQVFVWTGTGFVQRPMGRQGRPGVTPQITVHVERIDPDLTSTVELSGTAENPVMLFKIAAPRGPIGPSAAIVTADDYDATLPPSNGQVLTWNDDLGESGLWEPSDFASKHPQLFSIPEAAFQDMAGIVNGRQTILSYPIPPLDFAWVPYVQGHFKGFGVDLNILDPFSIGSEVRLGDPLNGTLIGRGVGNISTQSVVVPHFSSPGDPSAAVSPDNGVAQVAAGQSVTINVNLVNDGLIGAYSFSSANAQLSILAIPQGE